MPDLPVVIMSMSIVPVLGSVAAVCVATWRRWEASGRGRDLHEPDGFMDISRGHHGRHPHLGEGLRDPDHAL
jgi:hypothetical protein